MASLDEYLIGPEATVAAALETINRSEGKIALVVDSDRRLMGVVTDGDFRRGLLRGIGLDKPVSQIMNPKPVVARQGEDKARLLALMRREQYRQIPLVDATGRVVGLETLLEMLQIAERDNWVVLLAGGKGIRLKPLTHAMPKPMLQVGSKPILENILDSMVEQGFRKFFFAVNYMADSIYEHFGDGSRFHVQIEYLKEKEPLGTAGALTLLPEKPTAPLVVMNGDILTKVDYRALLDFHGRNRAMATMCVREFQFQVPFGVVSVDQHRIVDIKEKPEERFLVNAGIYALDPDAIDRIPKDQPYDMPKLFDALLAERKEAIVFPLREYWLDIGRLDDFIRANDEYAREFEQDKP